MKHNSYFPVRVGDQIIWLKTYRNKLPAYTATLGYEISEVTDQQADADSCIYMLETWQPAAQKFAQGGTSAVHHLLYSKNLTPITLPVFVLPDPPAPPAPVPPGALRRIFAFIDNMKTRDGYTDPIGVDLGIIGSEVTPDPDAVPPVKAEVRSDEVKLIFKKHGHIGVWIESQVADETEWTFLAVDLASPYDDSRPLKVAGHPEKRRYRLCYWNGGPSHNWTPIIEVTYGG